uniref:Uncharacterized protein n=1 Tax=Candidatus Nitrotoga fabula TaxID=2182327 RepID=A0A2X0SEE3_9PROT|nr:protein of unknown function [Candidatus Nitrotoga fabula]
MKKHNLGAKAEPDRVAGMNLLQQKQTGLQDKPAQPTEQQKAKGRRITSPVLLPLDNGEGF